MDEEDYTRAEEDVRKMGLDPAAIAHHRPQGPPENASVYLIFLDMPTSSSLRPTARIQDYEGFGVCQECRG